MLIKITPAHTASLQDIIKVRGFQVSPSEIEQCLLLLPSIVDVAVVGVYFGDKRGELPRAYIVVHPEHNITDQEIKAYMREKLIYYKWLKGGIRRLTSLPRNSTGKIMKHQLRKQAYEEIEKEQGELSSAEHSDNTTFNEDKDYFETKRLKSVLHGIENDPIVGFPSPL